jgi:nucleoid-associated protein YgaU
MTGFSAGVSVGGSAAGAVGGAVGAAAGAVGAAVQASPVGAVAGAVGAAAGVAVGVATAIGALIPATLRCTEANSSFGFVPFDFNPTEITITRSATHQSHPASGTGSGTPTGSGGAIIWKSDPPTISISKIIFEGLTTKLRCDTLLNWQSPPMVDPKAIGKQATGNPIDAQPPKLTFQWGPPFVGFMYDVRLTSTTIAYKRFNPIGIPIRAEITLKMQQCKSWGADLPTNPTSGGPGGRFTHLVKAGESLQSIAVRYYGTPSAWRPIAAVNRIDDPARLRPGVTVYLPTAGELTGINA